MLVFVIERMEETRQTNRRTKRKSLEEFTTRREWGGEIRKKTVDRESVTNFVGKKNMKII